MGTCVMDVSKGVAPGGRPRDTLAFDAERLRTELSDTTPLRAIVRETLSELPLHVPQLRASLADGRLTSVAIHARRLAQLFGSLLAYPASEAALRLRFAAESGSALPDLEAALDGLDREVERLMRDLADQLDALS